MVKVCKTITKRLNLKEAAISVRRYFEVFTLCSPFICIRSFSRILYRTTHFKFVPPVNIAQLLKDFTVHDKVTRVASGQLGFDLTEVDGAK